MTLKSIFTPTCLIVLSLTLFLACGENNSSGKSDLADDRQTVDQTLTIDTFSTFPPEIDGCACYFSNDATEFTKGHFIYANDFAQISFLKINGVVTKFIQTSIKKINNTTSIAQSKSDRYGLTIEVKDGLQSGDEATLKSGTIKLTDGNGKTITKNFYGECGC